MGAVIKVEKNLIKLAKEYLQVPEIYVWVGHGFDPMDNNNERVFQTRDLMKKYYSHIPYGLNVGNKQPDGSFAPISDIDNDAFYDVDVSWWPEGVYRFNYHSLPGVPSPIGKVFSERRDGEVSWPVFWENWNEEIKKETLSFIHKEKNGAGYCFRILIKPDRTIEPFGDLDLQ